jgi:hypothetical protein
MSVTLLVIIGAIVLVDLVVILALLGVAKRSDRRLEQQGVLPSEEQAVGDARPPGSTSPTSRGSTIR